MCSWGKLWTKRKKKTKNPTATSEELGAKTEYWEQKQGIVHTPVHTTKGVGKPLSHSSGPTPGPTLTLILYEEH